MLLFTKVGASQRVVMAALFPSILHLSCRPMSKFHQLLMYWRIKVYTMQSADSLWGLRVPTTPATVRVDCIKYCYYSTSRPCSTWRHTAINAVSAQNDVVSFYVWFTGQCTLGYFQTTAADEISPLPKVTECPNAELLRI